MFDLIPFNRRERRLWNLMDNDFSRMFRQFGSDRNMSTDIVDKGDYFELTAEMPGMAKENIQLDVSGDYLTISAEHKSENESEEKQYVCRERSYCQYKRSFNISDIKAKEIKASYKDGVLHVTLPKKEATPIEDTQFRLEIE